MDVAESCRSKMLEPQLARFLLSAGIRVRLKACEAIFVSKLNSMSRQVAPIMMIWRGRDRRKAVDMDRRKPSTEDWRAFAALGKLGLADLELPMAALTSCRLGEIAYIAASDRGLSR